MTEKARRYTFINYIIFTKKEHNPSSKRLLLKTLIIMLLFFPICCTISLFHEEISRWLQGQKIQTGFFLLNDDYIFDVLKINDVRLFEKVIFSSTNNIQFDSKYLKYFWIVYLKIDLFESERGLGQSHKKSIHLSNRVRRESTYRCWRFLPKHLTKTLTPLLKLMISA